MDIELPELPIAFMNDDHVHAKTLWRTMVSAMTELPAPNEALTAACLAFLEHNRAHFGREEAAMQQHGFPPYPVHKAEHDRALAMLEALVAAAESGQDPEGLRRTIEQDIPTWLVQHVQSMDMITARWIAAHA